MIEVQQINSRAVAGSGIGPLDTQLPIPVPEFYNGTRESGDASDVATDFQPVVVTAGTLVSGIDIILNGIVNAAVVRIDEVEPNDKNKKAQRINLPVEISASAAFNDPSVLRMIFPTQEPDKIEDIYRFDLDVQGVVYILLEPVGGAPTSDLDMYVFDSTLGKKKVSIDSATVRGIGAGPTANELIGIRLDPGTYYIGVSAFGTTSVNYKLRVLTAQ